MSGKGSTRRPKYSEIPAKVAALEDEIDRLKEQMYLLGARVQQVAPGPGSTVASDDEIIRDYREKKARRDER